MDVHVSDKRLDSKHAQTTRGETLLRLTRPGSGGVVVMAARSRDVIGQLHLHVAIKLRMLLSVTVFGRCCLVQKGALSALSSTISGISGLREVCMWPGRA